MNYKIYFIRLSVLYFFINHNIFRLDVTVNNRKRMQIFQGENQTAGVKLRIIDLEQSLKEKKNLYESFMHWQSPISRMASNNSTPLTYSTRK